MSRPIGWGIVGIGRHVEQRVALAFRLAARTRVVAVCSRSLDKAGEFAQRHDVAQACDSFAEMLRNPALDAVYIGTPNNMHARQTVQAAQAGKHVLCEKPMALSEGDCENMIEACEKNRVKLGVVLQNRYHPAHVEARRLLRAGEIGAISAAKAQYGNVRMQASLRHGWRSDPEMAGAGALMGTGLHPIDLLRFLLDSEVDEVRAWCEPQLPRVDEIVYAILGFGNGICGTVISGVVPWSDNDAVLYGERGRITCKGTVGMPLKGELLVEGDAVNLKKSFPTDNPEPANYVELVEAFNRCIRDDTSPDISGYDGLQLCRIANAILESSRLGKAVTVRRARSDRVPSKVRYR